MSYKIVNVVATADLKQFIQILDLADLPYTIHDSEIYGGRVTYVKMPQMKGKVTVFPSGKLISIGTTSYKEAKRDLEDTKRYLIENLFIVNIELNVKTTNIVCVFDLNIAVDLENFVNESNVMYEPEQFSGAIYKNENSGPTYLVFASGKIIITGLRDFNNIEEKVSNIRKIIEKYLLN